MQILRFILVLTFLFFFNVCAKAENINIEKLNFELGMQSLKQNHLDEAIKYFNLVVDKNPMNVEAHYNLAVTYKKLGQNDNALTHFNKVVELLNSPQSPESELTKIARMKQNGDENFDVYTQVKSKENDYIDLGDMHSDNGQCKTAIEYYNLALKLNPYNDNTYYKVSKCYVEQGDYANAEPYIRRALELDSSNSRYQYYKDLVAKNVDSKNRIVLQNFNEADPIKEYEDKYYNKELYQDSFPQKQKAGKTLTAQQPEDNDKKEILQKLSNQDYNDFSYKPSQELDYIDLGDLHFDNREYETAVEYYNMAIKINPNNDYTYYKLSRCYIELGKTDEADKYIEKAIALSGKNSNYVYFKNRIDDTIAGKPFENEPAEKNYASDSGFYADEIAEEPGQYNDSYAVKQPSLFDRLKTAISSLRAPRLSDISLKVPTMPEIKMPKLQGKVETEGQQPVQDDTIFNRDMKRYKITENPVLPPTKEITGEEKPQSPYSPDTYNDKGIEFFNANNLDKAEDYFRKAVQLRPMDPRGYNNLANVEFKRGDYDKAKEYALRAVEADPQFPQGYYNLAVISKKQKDYEAEIYYLNRSIAADPKYYQAYFARALAYYRKGDNDKAKYNFTEVLNLKNDHYLASQNLGIIYANELNYQQAERYLQQAVRLNRNNPQSYYYLGFSQQNSGKLMESIENLRKATELDPSNNRAYVSLSKSYDLVGKPDMAVDSLLKAVEMNPDNAEIYNYLGLMDLKVNNYKDACMAFYNATQKNSKRPIYFYNLSQCYLTLGKRKESNIAFQQAVSIIPVSVQDYIDLSEIFFDRGMTSYAVESLKTGIEQLPESDYLYLVLSDFYERTGAKKAAKEILEQYLHKKDFTESSFSLLVRKRLNELEN